MLTFKSMHTVFACLQLVQFVRVLKQTQNGAKYSKEMFIFQENKIRLGSSFREIKQTIHCLLKNKGAGLTQSI